MRKIARRLRRILSRDRDQLALGAVRFGDLARTVPVSECYGYDRGQPIDRYYIEKFLFSAAADIRRRVLEIGDNTYTVTFGGGRVLQSDILHVDASNPKATLVGDLCDTSVLPDNAFDCIILTQTLQLIFDMPAAISTLARSLKPSGVLLITVPGITPILGHWSGSWYWSLTGVSLARLLAINFDPRDISVATYGNVFSAVCFLEGLAVSEVQTRKLDVNDAAFPVIVAARAVKRAE